MNGQLGVIIRIFLCQYAIEGYESTYEQRILRQGVHSTKIGDILAKAEAKSNMILSGVMEGMVRNILNEHCISVVINEGPGQVPEDRNYQTVGPINIRLGEIIMAPTTTN